MRPVSDLSRLAVMALAVGAAVTLCLPNVGLAQGTTVGTYRTSRPNRAVRWWL